MEYGSEEFNSSKEATDLMHDVRTSNFFPFDHPIAIITQLLRIIMEAM